jgi:hypothetical protein
VSNGGCDHYCTDTYDSYHCTCRDGFTLVQSPINCPGYNPFGRKKREAPAEIELEAAASAELQPHVRTKRQSSVTCQDILDLVFVVDTTADIRNDNPTDSSYDNWNLVLEFIISVLSQFDVREDLTRVGVVMYSTFAYHSFYLDNNFQNDRPTLEQQIRTSFYYGGRTRSIAAGILLADTEQFLQARGDRPGVRNVMVVIAAGPATEDTGFTRTYAEDARNKGIDVYVFGLTNQVNRQELQVISSSPQQENRNYWVATGYLSLTNYVDALVRAICSSTDPITPSPPTTGPLYCTVSDDGIRICYCTSVTPVRSVNGTRCQDINECLINNGGCEHTCTNLDGSYMCSCNRGFRQGTTMKECEDHNECTENPNICRDNGRCVNTIGAYYCISGVVGSGSSPFTAAEVTVGTTSSWGVILGVVLSVINIAIVIAIYVTYRRRKRYEDLKGTELADIQSRASSSPSFYKVGTLRSFNSLSSKFSRPNMFSSSVTEPEYS